MHPSEPSGFTKVKAAHQLGCSKAEVMGVLTPLYKIQSRRLANTAERASTDRTKVDNGTPKEVRAVNLASDAYRDEMGIQDRGFMRVPFDNPELQSQPDEED